MDITTLYGSRIKQLRKQAKLSQTELSNRAGLSLSSLRRYESNERAPRTTDLEKIAAALNIHLSDLLETTLLDRATRYIEKNHPDIPPERVEAAIQSIVDSAIQDKYIDAVNEADRIGDEAFLERMVDVPDSYFLEETIKSFNRLNKRGKREALRTVAALLEDSRFTRRL